MTAQLVVDRGSGRTFVHFVLDPHHDDVSVVGRSTTGCPA